MKSFFVEENGKEKKSYRSIVVEPKSLSILNNELSLKIVRELARKPVCALDIARALNEHEQKIYYHLRKLESAGIIHLLRFEKRFGMTAKIYDVVSPVVAAKLYEDSNVVTGPSIMMPDILRLLNPFITNGKFDALVILGDTYSHGKYDMHSTEGVHAFDLAFMLGLCTGETVFPHYKLDTEVAAEELKNNLIIIGHPQTNVILGQLNAEMPIFFDESDNWSLQVRGSAKKNRDPRCGAIIKTVNPFDRTKKVLIFAGRTRGTQSAILAFTKFVKKMNDGIRNPEEFHLLVQGYDKSGDRIIDDVMVME